MQLNKLFESRPFKTRNADEIDLSIMLDLFVDPGKSLSNPFEFENTIIKGKMGTGKTMLLRANQAYYLYTLIPTLLSGESPIVPIYIRLSDFQHISDPAKIYKEIILKIIKEFCFAYRHLDDAEKLRDLHKGFLSIPEKVINIKGNLRSTIDNYRKLSSDEYVEKIKKETGLSIKAKPEIFEIFAKYYETNELELKKKPEAGISDVEDAYQCLLSENNGKILLLFDEAGSINRSFYRRSEDQDSYYEILMNQLRTLSFLRTKIAVYPQTYTDILTETRYGDVLLLEEDIESEVGYQKFYDRAKSIILRYCRNSIGIEISIIDIFGFSIPEEDPIEQLINASDGNMRRFLNLIDMTFTQSYDNDKDDLVTYHDVISAMIINANSVESMYAEQERQFLNILTSACKSRGTYKFTFPNNAPMLYKYTQKSAEYNIINISNAGIGRRSTVYSFDYTYCVKNAIPTHYITNSEKIDKIRSRLTGCWITRVTSISEEIMQNAEMPGKLDGIIDLLKDNSIGFINGADGVSYYWDKGDIIEPDKNKHFFIGKNVRFYPVKQENINYAIYIELL
jgi:hypothetical protein